MGDRSDVQIVTAAVEWISKTPIALATICFSFFSGHMWAYVIFTYKRERKHSKGFLDNRTGKVALGLLWQSLIAAPVYLIHYKTLIGINYDNYAAIAYDVILYSFLLQALIVMLLTIFAKGR